MCGMTLKGKGCAKTSLVAEPPLAMEAQPSSSSCIPGAPAPDAAWYVDMMQPAHQPAWSATWPLAAACAARTRASCPGDGGQATASGSDG
jgi:hypothetical protein